MIEGNPVPPAEPSLICLPHTKGSTCYAEKPPTESELAESDYGFDESEEEGKVWDEGDGEQRSDSESETEYRGCEEWHGARKVEAKICRKELSMPHPKERGKRRAETPRTERGLGAAKRTRLDLSSSERPDESRGSASKSSSGRGASNRGRAAQRP